MNKLSILVFAALAVVAVVAQNSDDLLADFNRVLAESGKKFRSNSERKMRLEVFRKNREEVLAQNADPSATYTAELNALSLQTIEEIVASQTGAVVPDNIEIPTEVPENSRVKRAAIPENFDLSPFSTKVYNQGQCGSCWAYAALEALEIKYNQARSKTSFSKQQLVDCAKYGVCNGCDGGWPTQAWDWLGFRNGSYIEQDYPYTNQSLIQGTTGVCTLPRGKSTVVKRVSYKNLPANYPSYWREQMYTNKAAIVVAMYVTSAFSRYRSGVFTDPRNYTGVNHAVVITGYGVDNTTKLPFWKVKNSWGTSWGDQGYIRVRSDVNTLNFNKYGMMLTNFS